ncbi:hypothetical protein GCM10029992_17280 [Glycomyces albus]
MRANQIATAIIPATAARITPPASPVSAPTPPHAASNPKNPAKTHVNQSGDRTLKYMTKP